LTWSYTLKFPCRNNYDITRNAIVICRCQWTRGLRRGSATAWLLGLRVWIPPVARLSLLCCVVSVKGLCEGLITRPEESYRMWCVFLRVTVKSWCIGGPGPLGAVVSDGGWGGGILSVLLLCFSEFEILVCRIFKVEDFTRNM